ncbi:MAG: hypothetical protein JWQ89_4512, partial [Devosia sp.]|nr:hypothetical protein [Devosia sp.]
MPLTTFSADARARRGVRLVERVKLQAMILARPEPIILLEAPAGMGKSVLL